MKLPLPYRSLLVMFSAFFLMCIVDGNVLASCKNWSGKHKNGDKISCEDIKKWLGEHEKNLEKSKKTKIQVYDF